MCAGDNRTRHLPSQDGILKLIGSGKKFLLKQLKKMVTPTFQISTQLTSHDTEGIIITSLQVVALMGKTRKLSVQVVSVQTGLVGATRSSEE